MAQHGHISILNGFDQTAGLGIVIKPKSGVDARYHKVKPCKHFIRIIQRAIGQDIALNALVDSKLTTITFVQFVNFRPLLLHLLNRKSPGVSRCPAVVGNP